ncbi:precorrin-3B synthase [Gordonia caeni]|uniref:precorrin-3B synthase n=1 Tax=Gordonia caeni TaxID=1007097 RepID=UPI0031D7B9C8
MNRPTDRCPGVFATHEAADGRLARLRLPGGVLTPARLEALALAAEELGDGYIELTGRANVQVRGIAADDVETFADRMIAAGLAGSRSHDRVRNIVVSPLTGRLGGTSELWTVADRLGDVLRASDRAQELSGRFWFGLDDGRGDVLARTPDVVGLWSGDDRAELVIADHRTGRTISFDDLADTLLDVALAFLDLRTDEWRIADLPADRHRELHRRFAGIGAPGKAAPPADAPVGPRVGWFGQDDGRVLLGAVTPLHRLSARQAQFAAAVGAPLIVTPDRELLIADLTEGVAETVVRVLAPLGLIFDAGSAWTRASACTGAPGCANARTDVRRLLSEHVDRGGDLDGREHWVACERGCGSPPDALVRVLGAAPGDAEVG